LVQDAPFSNLRYASIMSHAPILLGTSSFTATGWQGSFYPGGMKPSEYLAFYAERFHTVEVDSTFYACPTARTVENWNAQTPDGLVFSVKVPRSWVDFYYQIRKRGVLI
jgi:uncharacterized protein YecE (DUF72 family)